jgi:hypothetical protein
LLVLALVRVASDVNVPLGVMVQLYVRLSPLITWLIVGDQGAQESRLMLKLASKITIVSRRELTPHELLALYSTTYVPLLDGVQEKLVLVELDDW